MSEFVNELVSKLQHKISDEDLKTVHLYASMLSNDYNIVRKETLPAVRFEDIPEVRYYLVSRKIEGLSEGSIIQYGRTLKKLFTDIQKSPKDVTANDIRIYIYKLMNTTKNKDRSLNTQLTYIRAFFQWCVDNDYLEKNPCKQLKPIKYEKKEKQPMSPLDMEKLRNSCKTLRDKAMVETLYSTGCRISELCGIKLSDINKFDKSILIYGKGKKERIVYLNAKAELAISEYLKWRIGESEYLFCSYRAPYKQLEPCALQKVFREVSNEIGVRTHAHKLRRTMATDAVEHGMPIEEVRLLLGHENLDTTLEYAKTRMSSVKVNHAKYIV